MIAYAVRRVLDAKVVASAVLWGGVPRLLLQAGREKRAELFTGMALRPPQPVGQRRPCVR